MLESEDADATMYSNIGCHLTYRIF